MSRTGVQYTKSVDYSHDETVKSVNKTFNDVSRPGNAYAKAPSATAGRNLESSHAGVYASADTGSARAGISVVDASAVGPSARANAKANPRNLEARANFKLGSAEARASILSANVGLVDVAAGAGFGADGAKLMGKADLISANANFGGVSAKVGVNFTTGFDVGPKGVEMKLGGNGFAVKDNKFEVSTTFGSFAIPKFWW